jgi:hypothetical protein
MKFSHYLKKIQKESFEKIINLRLNFLTDFDNDLTSSILVLSKDRAMQLHTLLSTYQEMITNCNQIIVLYTCSDIQHSNSYKEVIDNFDNVKFVRETNFRDDVIRIFKKSENAKIAFMTDDQFFKEKIDVHELVKYNPYKYLFSMNRGVDSRVNFGGKQRLPDFIEKHFSHSEHIFWKWDSNIESEDWSYPLSVSGVYFSRLEMLELLQMIDFKGPNSLEGFLQIFLNTFSPRYGVCAKKAILGSVPCNVVSVESNVSDTGEHSSVELLTKWNAGYRIKYENFYGKKWDDLFFCKFEFVKRNKRP